MYERKYDPTITGIISTNSSKDYGSNEFTTSGAKVLMGTLERVQTQGGIATKTARNHKNTVTCCTEVTACYCV